jgi:hypothetical protein
MAAFLTDRLLSPRTVPTTAAFFSHPPRHPPRPIDRFSGAGCPDERPQFFHFTTIEHAS